MPSGVDADEAITKFVLEMGNPETLLVEGMLDDVEFPYGADVDELGRSIFVTGPVPERALVRTMDVVELRKGADDGKPTLVLGNGNPDTDEDVVSQGGAMVVELPYGADDDGRYVDERISVTSGIEVKNPEVGTVGDEVDMTSVLTDGRAELASMVDTGKIEDVEKTELRRMSVFKEEMAINVLDEELESEGKTDGISCVLLVSELEMIIVVLDIELGVVSELLVLDDDERTSVGRTLRDTDVEVGKTEKDVEETPHAPEIEGTASTPVPIATKFVPQFAALARRRFWLSWSYTTKAALKKESPRTGAVSSAAKPT